MVGSSEDTSVVKAKGKVEKPKAKKKVTAQEAPEAKTPQRKAEALTDSRVGAGGVRGVIEGTVARFYDDLHGEGTATYDEEGRLDPDMAEEAYILTLYFMTGHPDDKPRRPLKFREHEYGDPPTCKEHA